jgi:hypothetical protein
MAAWEMMRRKGREFTGKQQKDRSLRQPLQCNGARPCRSWLASEDGVSVDIDAEYQSAFASKPAPTVYLCRARDLYTPDPLSELPQAYFG